ncbi:hypothetical protein AB0L63_25580 [Nocardia sp. NPDC051990]|uniref:WXG100-like domain-containing protein n=1 Tax=Nocardia sp. NPDC051990 TaxID=3155285 RepID=UPI00341B27EE
MTLTLPAAFPKWLVEAVAGYWPDCDEDACRREGDHWKTTGDSCRQLGKRHDVAAATEKSALRGYSADTKATRNAQLGDDLRNQATYCDSMAEQCYQKANDCEFTKLQVIGTGIALLAQLAVDVWLAAPGVVKAAEDRAAAKASWTASARRYHGKVKKVGLECATKRKGLPLAKATAIGFVLGAGTAAAVNTGAQLWQKEVFHHRDKMEWDLVRDAAIIAGVGGGIGARFASRFAPGINKFLGKLAAKSESNFVRYSTHVTSGLLIGGVGGLAGAGSGAVAGAVVAWHLPNADELRTAVIQGLVGGFVGSATVFARPLPPGMRVTAKTDTPNSSASTTPPSTTPQGGTTPPGGTPPSGGTPPPAPAGGTPPSGGITPPGGTRPPVVPPTGGTPPPPVPPTGGHPPPVPPTGGHPPPVVPPTGGTPPPAAPRPDTGTPPSGSGPHPPGTTGQRPDATGPDPTGGKPATPRPDSDGSRPGATPPPAAPRPDTGTPPSGSGPHPPGTTGQRPDATGPDPTGGRPATPRPDERVWPPRAPDEEAAPRPDPDHRQPERKPAETEPQPKTPPHTAPPEGAEPTPPSAHKPDQPAPANPDHTVPPGEDHSAAHGDRSDGDTPQTGQRHKPEDTDSDGNASNPGKAKPDTHDGQGTATRGPDNQPGTTPRDLEPPAFPQHDQPTTPREGPYPGDKLVASGPPRHLPGEAETTTPGEGTEGNGHSARKPTSAEPKPETTTSKPAEPTPGEKPRESRSGEPGENQGTPQLRPHPRDEPVASDPPLEAPHETIAPEPDGPQHPPTSEFDPTQPLSARNMPPSDQLEFVRQGGETSNEYEVYYQGNPIGIIELIPQGGGVGFNQVVYYEGDPIGIYKPREREEYAVAIKNEVSAWSIDDQMLGLDLIPYTREWTGPEGKGTLQEFVPNHGPAWELGTPQGQALAVFDYIMASGDRHYANALQRADVPGGIAGIDNESILPNLRADGVGMIRSNSVVKNFDQPLDPGLIEHLRTVDPDEFSAYLQSLDYPASTADSAARRLAEVQQHGKITGEAWGAAIANETLKVVYPPGYRNMGEYLDDHPLTDKEI